MAFKWNCLENRPVSSPYCFVKSNKKIGEIIVRDGHEVEWKIKDFFSYTKIYVPYNSPKISILGSEWCLRIYPNGKKEISSVEQIALFLFRRDRDCTQSPIGAIFSCGLRKVDGSVEEHMDCSWLFDKNDEGFGYGIFLERSDLLNRKSNLAPFDILRVTCKIKLANDEFDSLERLDKLPENFLDLFTSKRACDVTFKVKNESFPAHISVIVARSPKFARMFESDLKGKNWVVFEMQDCEPEPFKEFLMYLYTGTLGKFSNNVFKVYEIAQICCVHELKTLCVLSIIAHLSLKNVCDAAILGHRSGEHELKIKAQDFFVDNFSEIVSTERWISLMKDHTMVANELLQRLSDVKLM